MYNIMFLLWNVNVTDWLQHGWQILKRIPLEMESAKWPAQAAWFIYLYLFVCLFVLHGNTWWIARKLDAPVSRFLATGPLREHSTTYLQSQLITSVIVRSRGLRPPRRPLEGARGAAENCREVEKNVLPEEQKTNWATQNVLRLINESLPKSWIKH